MNAFIIGRVYYQKFHCILQNLLILYAQYVIAEFGHEELDLHSICIIDHTLPSINRAIISTFTYTSMASNSTSNCKCYFAVRLHVRVLLLP